MSRFLLGFAVGAAIGVAVGALTTPRTGAPLRRMLSERVQGALDAARQASATQQSALWADYQQRIKAAAEGPPRLPFPGHNQ